MFVIVRADGTVRRTFKGATAKNIIELACELQSDEDPTFEKRLEHARKALVEDDAWVS